MLEYFDKLLFNAIVEYNKLINRCSVDPEFAYMVDRCEIGEAQERYMIQIVNAAESAGAISRDEWITIRHIVAMIGLGGDDFYEGVYNDLLYEVDA